MQNASQWAVLITAFFLANAPFVSDRFLGVIRRTKSMGLRFFELLIGYLITGALGVYLESVGGQVSPQGWAFYAVTGCLFLVLAFPGFVYRYLWRKPTVLAGRSSAEDMDSH